MSMGDQDAVQALEPDPGLQDLALSAFAAIHEEAVFVVHNHLGGQVAAGRRCRGGCAEKDEFEQWSPFLEIG